MSKSDFRKHCLQQLRSQNPHTRIHRNREVRLLLERVLKTLEDKKILFYWPLEHEADLRKSIRKLRSKKKLFLPFMDGVSFKMVPFRYPLERKAFGIYEPRDSYSKNNLIDVAIVPVVGVDGSLRRIGFGKGMYDRFFPTLKTKPMIIFIQSCACQTTQIVCDDYDVQGDLLITPYGIQSIRKKNVERTTRRGRCRSRERVGRIFNFKKDYRSSF